MVMARYGRLASGFNSGIGASLAAGSGVLLSLRSADVVAALVESGSTAESSTAEGVALGGKAVAERGFEGLALVAVGLLKRSRRVDL